MNSPENRRKSPDRRKTVIKNFPNERRNSVRREEDKKNSIAYYTVLGINIGLLAIFGISSYLVK